MQNLKFKVIKNFKFLWDSVTLLKKTVNIVRLETQGKYQVWNTTIVSDTILHVSWVERHYN